MADTADIDQMAQIRLAQRRLTSPSGMVADSTWVRQAFLVPPTVGSNGASQSSLSDVDKQNRGYSSATFKYTDSTVGGNFCINPPPQFTPYADIPVKGLSRQSVEQGIAYSAGFTGMGRYYSEAIDDNNRIVHLSFGFVSYNSLTQFFTGFYTPSLATLARTGRSTTGFIDMFLKTAFSVINLAILPLTIIPILFVTVANAIRFALKIPASKFCYFKEGMTSYWKVVNNLVNQLAVNRQLVTYTQSSVFESFIGEKPKLDNATKTIFHQIFPEMSEDGVIDVYAIANRAKRLEQRHRKEMFRQLTALGDEGWYGKVRKVYSEGGGLEQIDAAETMPFSQKTFWEKFFAAEDLSKGDSEGIIETDLRTRKDTSSSATASGGETLESLKTEPYEPNVSDKFWDYFKASAADGSAWVSFRVDDTGSTTETFSNSTSPSSLADKLNSASKSARETHISFAEGNVDGAGVVKAALDGAVSILTNVADLLHIGGLVQFAGRAFVDIPEHWTDHAASVGETSTYTTTLISPYGNVVSQMMHIYIPLCMLLAGALPLATGKQSYTSPFVCQLYDRGRGITRLGIITSLTITRGTSNLAWDRNGNAMAIDVSFTVKDLSSVVSLPIHEGMSIMPLEGIFDSESKFTDYMMALSATSLPDAHDRLPILKRQLDTKIGQIKQIASPAMWGMQFASMLPGQLMNIFMSPTDKR